MIRLPSKNKSEADALGQRESNFCSLFIRGSQEAILPPWPSETSAPAFVSLHDLRCILESLEIDAKEFKRGSHGKRGTKIRSIYKRARLYKPHRTTEIILHSDSGHSKSLRPMPPPPSLPRLRAGETVAVMLGTK
eukprot:scaffold22607_cov123-Cylindrotheca_fusiformis.AAC.28